MIRLPCETCYAIPETAAHLAGDYLHHLCQFENSDLGAATPFSKPAEGLAAFAYDVEQHGTEDERQERDDGDAVNTGWQN